MIMHLKNETETEHIILKQIKSEKMFFTINLLECPFPLSSVLLVTKNTVLLSLGSHDDYHECWVNKYRSFVDPAFVIIIIGKKGERRGGGTLGVTEKKEKEKDWSGSILVVGYSPHYSL